MGMNEVLDIFSDDGKDLEPALDVKIPGDIVPIGDLPPVEEVDVSSKNIYEAAQRVKAAFFASKRPEEIRLFAANLPLLTWLDYFIKLQPKEVQVKGQFDVRQMIAQLGPVRRK
jgi:hypothetical protein